MATIAKAAEEGIAVIVNDNVITFSDMNDRLKLIMTSAGMPNTDDVRQKMLPQIASMLIEEQLKLQEASALDIQVSDEQIQEGLGRIAGQNKIPPEQFKKMLKQSGIKLNTLYEQIRAEIAWGGVVATKIRPQVDVTEADIDAEIAQLEKNIGQEEYLLSEIFLGVDSSTNESDIKQTITKIGQQLRKDPNSFPVLARQFSQSAGAGNGGDLGWVEAGQLDDDIRTAIAALSNAGVTAPIRTTGGYHIMLLRSKRQIAQDTIPDRDQILSKIGNQRLGRRAKSYLLDLKASAFIEKRV